MLNKSARLLHFLTPVGDHLPYPPLYQPEASCENLVSSRL